MTGGVIIGLDIGVRLGVAIGVPGSRPESFAVRLKKPRQDAGVALGNAIAFLNATLSRHAPALVVKEAPPALQGFANMGNAAHVVRMTFGIHAIVDGMAERFGIPCHEVHDATARKHFIGKGRMGDRDSTKRAVLTRCRQLGWIAADSTNEDAADALCVWDWACAHLARRPGAFQLFTEAA